MKVIGLTGGIASGKSTASAYLRELGAVIVDADAISRASTRRGGAAFEAVCAAFGDILGADGEIDRRKLGGIVFADEDARRKLNSIVHPAVMAESRAQIENARASGVKMCILDVPLLFETGMEKLCDETWLIYVPREEQVRRMAERDGLDAAAAAARIDSQMPLEEKERRATVVIDNRRSVEKLNSEVGSLYQALKKRIERMENE